MRKMFDTRLTFSENQISLRRVAKLCRASFPGLNGEKTVECCEFEFIMNSLGRVPGIYNSRVWETYEKVRTAV